MPGQPSTAQQVCQVSYPGYTGDLAAMLGTGGTVAGRAGAARDVLPPVGHPLPGQRLGRRRVLHRDLDRPRQRGAQPVRAARRDSGGYARVAGDGRRQHLHGHLRQRRRRADQPVLPGARADRGRRPHAGAQLLRHRRRGGRPDEPAAGRAADRQQRRLDVHRVQVDRVRQRRARLRHQHAVRAVGRPHDHHRTARSPASTTAGPGTGSGARSRSRSRATTRATTATRSAAGSRSTTSSPRPSTTRRRGTPTCSATRSG